MVTITSWSDFPHHLDALLLALASSTDNFTVGLSVGIRQTPLPLWANGCISVCNAAGAWAAGHGGVWVVSSLYYYVSSVSATDEKEENGNNGENIINTTFPLYLSALAFGGLALSEWKGYKEEIAKKTISNGKKDDDDDLKPDGGGANNPQSKTMTNLWPVLKLAVPMTLNNLAGGVAGGAAGLTPEMSALYALLASFVTMLVGYRFGLRVGSAMAIHNNNNNNNNNKAAAKKNDQTISWLHPSLLSALLLGTLCVLTLKEAIFG